MSKSDIETPDYAQVDNPDECDEKIMECKETLFRKTKLKLQAEDNKKTVVSSYTEQIKFLKQEIEHEVAVCDGWLDRKKVILANGGAPDEEDAEEGEEEADPNVVKAVADVLASGKPGTVTVSVDQAPPPVVTPVTVPPPPAAVIPPPPTVTRPQATPMMSVVPFPTKAA